MTLTGGVASMYSGDVNLEGVSQKIMSILKLKKINQNQSRMMELKKKLI